MSKERQVKEIIKCGKDPEYFFNKYLKIQHPTQGLIHFDTYPFQNECIKDFIDHRFNIVLKSRQLGMSTLVAAYSVWMAVFQREKNILIIATKLAVAQNFIIKVKTMLRSLPKWLLLPEMTANNKQMVQFSHGSQIKAIPTSEDAGRSEALSLLIVDEAAFVRNFDTIWTGIYPTISTGGRVILLSTPNGVGGQYYKLYTEAQSGLNEFNPIKLMWDIVPDRDKEWFTKTTSNMNERQIAQEFLCDFTTSGETYLSIKDLNWIRDQVCEPIMRAGFDNNVWIWKQSLTECNYILSADVSRGDAKDFSTFHIINTDTSEVVVEYRGKIPPDRFAELIYEWGMKYSKALVCPENNSYGYATILKLQELKYPRLYYRKKGTPAIGEYIPPSDAGSAGFNTNSKSRGMILGKLEEVLRNKVIKCYSSRLYEELKTFAWGSSGKLQARKGFHDDLVMALAIGTWLFDASSDYSSSANKINDAMLKAMSKSTNEYTMSNSNIYSNGSVKNSTNKSIIDNPSIKIPGRINISDFKWIL